MTAPPLSAVEGALRTRDTDILDRALQTTVGYPEVVRACERLSGQNGIAEARRLVAGAADGTAFAAERIFLRLMRDAGITGWEVNKRLATGGNGSAIYPDFLLESAGLLFEIDGMAWHIGPERFQGDRQRQNAIAVLGLRVLRFTWYDLNERPSYVVAQVRAMIGDRNLGL